MTRLFRAAQQFMGRRFAREVLTLQVGSFATLGIQFIVSVAIANLLGPGPLGTYYQATALLSLVNMLANLAVGQALITRLAAANSQKDRAETLRILGYFLKVGFTVSLVESVVGLLAGSYLGSVVLEDGEIGQMARILFISPPLQVLLNMVTLALQSARQVGRLALLENGALIGTGILNVAAVLLTGDVSWLLASVAFAPLLTSLAAVALYRSTLPGMPVFPTLGAIFRAAPSVPYHRYFAFSALVSVDKNFANLIALAPTLLLGRLSTSDQVAYFRVAYNLMNFLSVPLSPISRNLYAKLSEIFAGGDTRRLRSSLLKVSMVSGGISTATTVVMLLAAPFILMIYRPEYGASLPVMYALGLRFALLGFGVVLGPVYQVLNAMKLAIATKVVPGTIMVVGGWFMISSYGAVGAALTIVGAYLVGDITNAVLVPWIVRTAARAPSVVGQR